MQKQPQPIVCTGEGLGALSWGTDFPGSSAEDSRCLWKNKKEVLLFILRLLTAILCNICCFLFQGGVHELSWEMVILGVDGVWCRGHLLSSFPAFLLTQGGSGRVTPSPSYSQNCLALVISLSPMCPLVPLRRVGRSKAVVRGDPSPQAPGHPGEASLNRKKKKNPS